MKTKLVTAFLFLSSLLFAQKIPEFSTNTNEKDRDFSIIFNKLFGKYDYIASFSMRCYWGEYQSYFVLANKKNKWLAMIYTFEFEAEGRNKKLDCIKKVYRKKALLSRNAAKEILLLTNQILPVEQDTLSKYTIKENNFSNKRELRPIVAIYSTDGCNHIFEFFTRKNYRQLSLYNPAELQAYEFSAWRALFLATKDLFIEAIKTKQK